MTEDNGLNWKFWSKQAIAIQHAQNGDYDIVCFLGGYRSGKSITGARWLTLSALENPDGQFLAMAVDYNKGKTTTYNVLFEHGLPNPENTNLNPFTGGNPTQSPVVHHWTKIDRTLTLVNGSTITLAGADEETRYEGGSFNAVWMDEPGNYRSKLDGVTSTVMERLDRGPPATSMWTTTGKQGPLQRILKRREWKDGSTVNLDIKIIRASTENNIFLNNDALQRLKRRYTNSVNEGMALKGEFGAVEGRVYPEFSRKTHVVNRDKVNVHDSWRVYGYDAGWKDPRVLVEIGKTALDQLVVLDVFYKSKSYVSDVIQWLQEGDKVEGRMYCEHEPGDIEKFRRELRWKAVKAEKNIDRGINTVRERLRLDGDGRPGLLVCSCCEKAVSEFESYQEEDVGGADVEDHFLDALRYAVMGVEDGGGGDRDVKVGSVRTI